MTTCVVCQILIEVWKVFLFLISNIQITYLNKFLVIYLFFKNNLKPNFFIWYYSNLFGQSDVLFFKHEQCFLFQFNLGLQRYKARFGLKVMTIMWPFQVLPFEYFKQSISLSPFYCALWIVTFSKLKRTYYFKKS